MLLEINLGEICRKYSSIRNHGAMVIERGEVCGNAIEVHLKRGASQSRKVDVSDRSVNFLGNRGKGSAIQRKLGNSTLRSGSVTGVLPVMGRPVSWLTMASDGEKSN